MRTETHDRAAVVGDIHGASHLLKKLVERLDGRHLISAGDINDRGPDTRGVLDQLVDVDATGVCGNHEQWFRDWLGGQPFDRFALSRAMGGRATLESYGIDPSGRLGDEDRARVPKAHADWLQDRPILLDLNVGGKAWWVAHAGVPMHISFRGLDPAIVLPRLEAVAPNELLWPKNRPDEMVALDRPVIMGHVPLREPYDGGHIVAVDTGAATFRTGGRLTALLLPERTFLTVG
jgi:serine/threonine protein phosphatase 1